MVITGGCDLQQVAQQEPIVDLQLQNQQVEEYCKIVKTLSPEHAE